MKIFRLPDRLDRMPMLKILVFFAAGIALAGRYELPLWFLAGAFVVTGVLALSLRSSAATAAMILTAGFAAAQFRSHVAPRSDRVGQRLHVVVDHLAQHGPDRDRNLPRSGFGLLRLGGGRRFRNGDGFRRGLRHGHSGLRHGACGRRRSRRFGSRGKPGTDSRSGRRSGFVTGSGFERHSGFGTDSGFGTGSRFGTLRRSFRRFGPCGLFGGLFGGRGRIVERHDDALFVTVADGLLLQPEQRGRDVLGFLRRSGFRSWRRSGFRNDDRFSRSGRSGRSDRLRRRFGHGLGFGCCDRSGFGGRFGFSGDECGFGRRFGIRLKSGFPLKFRLGIRRRRLRHSGRLRIGIPPGKRPGRIGRDRRIGFGKRLCGFRLRIERGS